MRPRRAAAQGRTRTRPLLPCVARGPCPDAAWRSEKTGETQNPGLVRLQFQLVVGACAWAGRDVAVRECERGHVVWVSMVRGRGGVVDVGAVAVVSGVVVPRGARAGERAVCVVMGRGRGVDAVVVVGFVGV